MMTLPYMRDTLAQWDAAHADVDSRGFTEDEEMLAGTGEELANGLRALLDDKVTVQMLALARLVRDREGQSFRVMPGGLGLPDGYLLVDFDGGQHAGGFTCGIAPNGDVSS
jgi:anti-sigma factor RsiW